MSTNFLQVVQQTRAQKTAMYMKIPKKKVVEMLVNCGELLSGFNAVVCYTESTPSKPGKKKGGEK